jgi:hypothetical protein
MTLKHTLNQAMRRNFQLLSATALTLASLAHAQETAPTPQSLEDALHQLSDAAGVIFVGEVIAIRHRAGENGASGIAEVDFRVDQAIRGCSTGIYTLREWAGLWSGGDQRYRVGQRLLMLLHAPNPAGVSSPVGGMDGAIPIRGAVSELAPQGGAASAAVANATSITTTRSASTAVAATSAPPVADLRWVGTRVLRSISFQTTTTPSTKPATANIDATSASLPPRADVTEASTAAQQAPVSVVVNMLAAWQTVQGNEQGIQHAVR